MTENQTTENNRPVSATQQAVEKFVGTARVEAAYGPPQQSGGAMVVPAAEVISVLGFGMGSGQGVVQNEAGQNNSGGGGGGGAAGGYSIARPVAVVVVSPDGVTVKPVLDLTKIIIAGITALGAMLVTLTRVIPARKRS